MTLALIYNNTAMVLPTYASIS